MRPWSPTPKDEDALVTGPDNEVEHSRIIYTRYPDWYKRLYYEWFNAVFFSALDHIHQIVCQSSRVMSTFCLRNPRYTASEIQIILTILTRSSRASCLKLTMFTISCKVISIRGMAEMNIMLLILKRIQTSILKMFLTWICFRKKTNREAQDDVTNSFCSHQWELISGIHVVNGRKGSYKHSCWTCICNSGKVGRLRYYIN